MNYSNSELFAYCQVYLTGRPENYEMYLAQGELIGVDELESYLKGRPRIYERIKEAIESVKQCSTESGAKD